MRELTRDERQLLAGFADRAEWKLLKDLLEQACREATDGLLKMNQGSGGATREAVASKQDQVRAQHELAAAFIDRVEFEMREARAAEEAGKAGDQESDEEPEFVPDVERRQRSR